jgi:hypothetical protein
MRRFWCHSKIETACQCLRLVGIDENLSFYEGDGDGPNVAKIKEAVNKFNQE